MHTAVALLADTLLWQMTLTLPLILTPNHNFLVLLHKQYALMETKVLWVNQMYILNADSTDQPMH